MKHSCNKFLFLSLFSSVDIMGSLVADFSKRSSGLGIAVRNAVNCLVTLLIS